MTDKVQKIREFLVGIANTDGVSTILARAIEKKILPYIDSLQEEHKKCMYALDDFNDEDRKALCDGCEEDCKYNKEEPVSEGLEEVIDAYLATYWGGEKEKQDWPFLKKMAIHFAKWQKEQIMKGAFVYEKKHDTAMVLASECLRNHGWFNRERDFNKLWRHLSCVDELFEGKFSGKTKVVVIKEG